MKSSNIQHEVQKRVGHFEDLEKVGPTQNQRPTVKSQMVRLLYTSEEYWDISPGLTWAVGPATRVDGFAEDQVAIVGDFGAVAKDEIRKGLGDEFRYEGEESLWRQFGPTQNELT